MIETVEPFGKAEDGADFTGGAAGVIEERNQLVGGPAVAGRQQRQLNRLRSQRRQLPCLRLGQFTAEQYFGQRIERRLLFCVSQGPLCTLSI